MCEIIPVLQDLSFLIKYLYAKSRDEYEALFGKGTGPLILARTDSLVTDGFGKPTMLSLPHN